jgi:short-subunit dehydrogenase
MIIWITGASSGLGRELARQYAVAGRTVCVSARGADALNSLRSECQEAAGAIHVYPLDITDIDKARECFAAICADVGLPDVCVFNAGTHAENPVTAFDRDTYRRLMDINFMGVINCLDAVVPAYLDKRGGRIAVVSSVAGYRGLPYASAYGASKAALINLCEALQPELAAAEVHLQVVNPGFVRTPLTDLNEFPMPFIMEVEDAAAQMMKGLAGGGFEVTFPRRFTWLLKILRMLPYALYLRLTRKLLRDV